MKEANQKLISSMAKLGYPMMEPVQELNVNQTLAEVVKSQEIRYWEGFPILLSKASENFLFKPELVEQLMDSEAQKRQFRALMILSGSLFLITIYLLHGGKSSKGTSQKQRESYSRNSVIL